MKDDKIMEESNDRQEILKKIEELEKIGEFDKDIENDPPTITLMPEEVDYLDEKLTSKVKTIFANSIGERFLESIIKAKKLLIKNINGMENLDKLEAGAVITCNHFNPFDVFAIEKVLMMSKLANTKKLYKVIKEGNYTNFPGLYGFFFRNCDTLPISSNNETMIKFMKATDTILKRGDLILIYPEQSLWWNYKKPRPLKQGAFRIAARNKVPVLPIFITMEDSSLIGDDGFPIQEYTINIEEAIYPNDTISEKENAQNMKKQNYDIWKKVYEEFYNMPLTYTTPKEKLKI